ncbi:MAG: hypothetical protein ACJ0F8_02930 [Gammaproteobacteria bacterium]|uniref:Type II secretion system protein GspC N-terminal domain-containing protein n=1 Tax=SAR86 cluster bacterium TaxID=2030880 RepID=A0A520N0C2_9GAMM|nr:hypothetical protein [Gammaproteobacteria bacterium]MBA4729646.1 hypothetical protein [SAR86 cluster bacterium]RZO26942.1 MAG: hypothetical protein EVA92_01995 [SAR86 cluster bacterium]|tara:strand:- start:22805 stop:23227 length:423 start_codon:yes stop_codon:yes gene_type:complete
MNRSDLVRLFIFSFFLIFILYFYLNSGLLSFTDTNITKTLPEAKIVEEKSSIIISNDISQAQKLDLGFELVGIRGNNPSSTIIILDIDKYRLIEQGESVKGRILFSHIDNSRAYFFDGQDYTFLDIIGTDRSFNSSKVNN